MVFGYLASLVLFRITAPTATCPSYGSPLASPFIALASNCSFPACLPSAGPLPLSWRAACLSWSAGCLAACQSGACEALSARTLRCGDGTCWPVRGRWGASWHGCRQAAAVWLSSRSVARLSGGCTGALLWLPWLNACRATCQCHLPASPAAVPTLSHHATGTLLAGKLVQWAARRWTEYASGARQRRKQLQARMDSATSYKAWAQAAQEARPLACWLERSKGDTSLPN